MITLATVLHRFCLGFHVYHTVTVRSMPSRCGFDIVRGVTVFEIIMLYTFFRGALRVSTVESDELESTSSGLLRLSMDADASGKCDSELIVDSEPTYARAGPASTAALPVALAVDPSAVPGALAVPAAESTTPTRRASLNSVRMEDHLS